MSFYESQEEARANLIMQVRETIDAAEQRGGLDAESLAKVEAIEADIEKIDRSLEVCLLYTSPSPRDKRQSRMPSSA